MLEKFKSFLTDDAVFYTALLILVAIASFGLGRQSVTVSGVRAPETATSPAVSIQNNAFQPQTASVITGEETEAVAVVASKSGSKYHLPTCPGASQIKAANKISFTTIQEAEAAGYTPAANCPGLK